MKKLLISLILGSVVLVSLSGCLGRDERQSWIDATVEAACLVLQSDNVFNPDLEEKTNNIYKEHGFDADNDDEMKALAEKYKVDEDAMVTIEVSVEECTGMSSEEISEALFGKTNVVVDEPTEDTDEEPAE